MKTNKLILTVVAITMFSMVLYSSALAVVFSERGEFSSNWNAIHLGEWSQMTPGESLRSQLKKALAFPSFLKSDTQEEVEAIVAFTITEEGTLSFLECTSDNSELNDYVVEQLKQVQLEDLQSLSGKTFKISLSFRYIQ